jgi:hypothetical protein
MGVEEQLLAEPLFVREPGWSCVLGVWISKGITATISSQYY